MHNCLLLWAPVGRSFIIASDSHSRMSFSMEHRAPVSQMNGTKPFCASAGLDFKLHVIFAPTTLWTGVLEWRWRGKGESRLGAGVQLSLLPACMNHIPPSNSSPSQTDSISLSVNQHVHSPSNYFVRHLATVIRKITSQRGSVPQNVFRLPPPDLLLCIPIVGLYPCNGRINKSQLCACVRAHAYLLKRTLRVETIHGVGHFVIAVRCGRVCSAQRFRRFHLMARKERQWEQVMGAVHIMAC